MAMDFFGEQESARARTRWLIVLFALAVMLLIALTYIAVVIFLAGIDWKWGDGEASANIHFFDPRLLALVGGGVLLLVGSATLYRLAQLRGGGRVVAEMLGGRLLDPGSRDADERRLLNVVEEMAIASGTSVPPVYLLDEATINAFAAGWSVDDAVIGVTRGAMRRLDREEMQGVIAHEFSHILNGDMRLNIRLIGVLNGILVIGLAGYGVLRSVRYLAISGGSSRRSSGKGGEAGMAIVAVLGLGIALVVIGFVGVFFGRLIKSAISRQREYLADAAAVQFTRNPHGISGALRKIGAHSTRGRLSHPRADEASHCYFAQGVPMLLDTLLATHPPLPERIRRIDPAWDGTFLPTSEPPPSSGSSSTIRADRTRPQRPTPREVLAGTPVTILGAAAAASAAHVAADEGVGEADAIESIGRPTAEHLAYARELIQALPEVLTAMAHDPFAARAVIFALLLDTDPTIRERQTRTIRRETDAELAKVFERAAGVVNRVDPAARLPLIDMTLPALRELSKGQYEDFKNLVRRLAEADQRISLFEWMLRRVMLRHLEPYFGAAPSRGARRHHHWRPIQEPLSVVLSTLAHTGARSPEQAAHAFHEAARRVPQAVLRFLSADEAGGASLDEALDVMIGITPRLKRELVLACAACIAADGQARVREVELLRAVCDTIEVPMPPLLPGQPFLHDASISLR